MLRLAQASVFLLYAWIAVAGEHPQEEERDAPFYRLPLCRPPKTWQLKQGVTLKEDKLQLLSLEEEDDSINGENITVLEGEENPECEGETKEEFEEEERHQLGVRLVIAIGMVCLLAMFFGGYFLDVYDVIWFPEAGAGILIGVLISFLAKTFAHASLTNLLRFDPEFFFIFLLPPIIFEAGYNMKRKAFFRNIGGICAYAFLGTTISCFAIGGMLYYAGRWHLCHPIGGLAALVFGALISATDPVTTLAVFQKLNADIDLYSLVFGESAMNDAVAIVLYRTLIQFKCGITSMGIGMAFLMFVIIFVGSTVIGFGVAMISALLTKYCKMRDHADFLYCELVVVCCFPYLAFCLAEAFKLSGIVAILFCGVGMSHYTSNNLSPHAAEVSRGFFKVLAKLSESFVFIYLGLAMFTFKQSWEQYLFFLIAFVACLLARILNVYPVSLLINLFRPKERRINQKVQFVIWFSGLRGAVAFLIAVESWGKDDFPQVADPVNYPHFTDSDVILNATLFIAVITVFTMGGTTGFLLKKFKLQAPEGEEPSSPLVIPPKGSLYIDRKYIKPIFTIRKWNPTSENPTGEEMRTQLIAEAEQVVAHDAADDDYGDENPTTPLKSPISSPPRGVSPLGRSSPLRGTPTRP